MVTLNDLSEFWQRNRKRILLVVLLLAAGGGAILFWQSSKESGGTEPTNGEEGGEIPAFSFAGDTWKISEQVNLGELAETGFPKETAVYKVEEQRVVFSEQQAQDVAARFNFEPEATNRVSLPGEGRMFVFAKDDVNLAVFSYPREIRYSFKDITAKTSKVVGKIYGQDAAIQKAKEYLEGKYLATADLVFFGARYLIYDVEAVTQTQNSSNANALELSFAQAVNGQKILGKTVSEPLVKIVFNRAGEVVSLSYKETDQTFTQFRIVPLLNFAEATGKLKEEGLVISILPTEDAKERFFETADLTSFTPQTVSLVYYQVPETDFLIPIYLFDGKGMLDTIEVYASVALPAGKP
uniref:Uncharacterized protein n=1 Tax=candidate division WWE3 bacterium TaxID=2053526 RepID=A0A831YYJ4_UNCKA